MNSFKKLIFVLLFAIVALVTWYVFIKANDFEVVIKVNTAPGTVYHHILGWNESLDEGETKTEFITKSPFERLVYTNQLESYNLQFDWRIKKINDSITKISIGVNDLNKSASTRIQKLFGTSPLEELISKEFTGFNAVLSKNLEQFKVVIKEKTISPESYAAYISTSCHQNEKALTMMGISTQINNFLKGNEIKLKSKPIVEITNWNRQTGNIDFNFCFPIEERESFPLHKEIKYKKVRARNSLKAAFKGNYSFTHNAWYALDQAAGEKKLKPLNTIIEVYDNNPHTDVKDITWTASIFMEIE
jgi:hypothetical protein